MREWLAYRWRRFHTLTVLGGLVCDRPRCGRERVGFSRYCRQHTDELLSRPGVRRITREDEHKVVADALRRRQGGFRP